MWLSNALCLIFCFNIVIICHLSPHGPDGVPSPVPLSAPPLLDGSPYLLRRIWPGGLPQGGSGPCICLRAVRQSRPVNGRPFLCGAVCETRWARRPDDRGPSAPPGRRTLFRAGDPLPGRGLALSVHRVFLRVAGHPGLSFRGPGLVRAGRRLGHRRRPGRAASARHRGCGRVSVRPARPAAGRPAPVADVGDPGRDVGDLHRRGWDRGGVCPPACVGDRRPGPGVSRLQRAGEGVVRSRAFVGHADRPRRAGGGPSAEGPGGPAGDRSEGP